MMLASTSRRSSRHRLTGKHVRLCLECLEDRSLLSAAPLGPPQLLITTSAGEVQKVLVADGASLDETLAAYHAREDVVTAEVDQRVWVSVVPNDSRFGELWGLNNTGQSAGTADADIDAAEAWNVATGSMKTVVGIIDTGIDYRHPDLYQNVWLNPGEIPASLGVVDADGDGVKTFRDLNLAANSGKASDLNGNGYVDAGDLLADSRWEDGVDQDGNGYRDDLIGWDFVSNDNDPYDDNNHGTHVAGTIGATGSNGTGVVGVNWKVSMAALKFLGADGSGSTSGAVLAQNYATNKGMKITNNSWGGGGPSTALANAIADFRGAGGIFVAAAGNAGSNNDTVANYPSNYNEDNVVAVAATDRRDQLASFSNYGATTVDLAAPGVAILSTTPNNTYSSFNGTSMATPHVAGAAALIWSANPTLSYSQVIARLKGNVDPLSTLTGKVATGGRLNVAKALGSSAGDSGGPRVLSATTLGSATAVTGVRLTFSESINASTFTKADVKNFIGPTGGSVSVRTVTAVAGSNNTQFDVTFSTTQTRAGSYRLDVGPDVRDLAGNKMDQDNDGVIGETSDYHRVTFVVTGTATITASSSGPVAIRDFAWSSSTITINQDVNVSDLNVKVNLSHTYDGDLFLVLVGPDGTEVVLSAFRGGSANNYTNTTFDDEAAKPIADGRAPFSGSFRAEELLSAFDGTNVRGTWTLWVWDGGPGDVGKINSWSLTVKGTVVAQASAFEAEGGSSAAVETGVASEVAAPAAEVGVVTFADPAATATVVSSKAADSSLPLFVLRETDERDETAPVVGTTLRQDGGRVTTASADDALRQRQEAIDELFAELTEGVGGGQKTDEWAPLAAEA